MRSLISLLLVSILFAPSVHAVESRGVQYAGVSSGLIPPSGVTACIVGAATDECLTDYEMDTTGRTIPLYSSFPVPGVTPNAAIDQVVIMVHGASRNADDYYDYLVSSAVLEGGTTLDDTLLVAPNFLIADDWLPGAPSATEHYWNTNTWIQCNLSQEATNRLSSCAMMDEIMEDVCNSAMFPNVSTVTLVGHSAGGQMANRYAAAGAGCANGSVQVRYVPMNPSSHVYPTDVRWTGAAFETLTGGDLTGCTTYDDYKYGYGDHPSTGTSYIDGQSLAGVLLPNLYGRETYYMSSSTDTSRTNGTDVGCEADWQGTNRNTRWGLYRDLEATIAEWYGSTFTEVDGTGHTNEGHSGEQMTDSPEVRAVLFKPYAAAPTPPATNTYRTIAIFGDSQDHINGPDAIDGGGRYEQMANQASWIIANKDSENIDFVLHVGDIIDNGVKFPPSLFGDATNADQCDDGPTPTPFPSDATCLGLGTSPYTDCTNTAGCFIYDPFGNPANGGCHSCEIVQNYVEPEWARFHTIKDMFRNEIPLLITKGNHDSPGEEYATNIYRDAEDGYNEVSVFAWEAMEADNYGTRGYEHVAQDSDATGDSHAWVVTLDTVDVLVVTIPYVSGVGSTNDTWANDQFLAHPTKPGILLIHDVNQTDFQDTLDVTAPNLFAVISGHHFFNRARILDTTSTNDSYVEIVIDWTGDTKDNVVDGYNDFIGLLRIYLATDEVEYVAYGPDSGMEAPDQCESYPCAAGLNEIALTSFDIMPPPVGGDPFDLTPYEAEMVAVFDDEEVARPAWPIAPTPGATTVITAAGDCSVFEDAVNSGAGSLTGPRKIELSAALTGCSINWNLDDIWLEMTNAGSITSTGDIIIQGDRIKIEGGAITSNRLWYQNNTDVLVDNTNITVTVDHSTDGQRHAIVNSDITSGSYSYNSYADSTDLIFCGNDILGGNTTGNTTFRIEIATRVIACSNRIENEGDSLGTARFWTSNTDILFVDNRIVSNGVQDNTGLSITTRDGVPSGSQCGDISNLAMVGNSFYYDGVRGTEVSQGIDTTNCPTDTCSGLTVAGNTSYETSGTFAISTYVASCSPTTTPANSSEPWVADPTCGLAGFICGADH